MNLPNTLLGIEVQIPDTGAWRYIKKDSQGRLVCGIYALSVLDETHLKECQAIYPNLNFRLTALPASALEQRN